MRPYGYLGSYLRVERAELRLCEVQKLATTFRAEWRDIGYPLGSLWLDGDLVELREVDVPDELSVAAGETIYNLRAALDYLVFALSWHDSGKRPTGAVARGLQFPIFDARKGSFDERSKRLLDGISEQHIAMLEDYQPYKGCAWMNRLQELSNADKHRHLLELIGRMSAESRPRHRSQPLDDAVPDKRGRYEMSDLVMIDEAQMDAAFADGGLVAPTLQNLCLEVRTLVERFGREFMLRPVEPRPDYLL